MPFHGFAALPQGIFDIISSAVFGNYKENTIITNTSFMEKEPCVMLGSFFNLCRGGRLPGAGLGWCLSGFFQEPVGICRHDFPTKNNKISAFTGDFRQKN